MKHLKDIANWQELINEVVCGDCLEGMKLIPNKSIDLVLTDPPYRIHANTGGGLHNKRDWLKNIHQADIDTFTPAPFLSELNRVMKTINAYIFCSKNLLSEYIQWINEMGLSWDILIYAKNNPIPTKNNKYLSDKEFCLFIRGDGAYFNNSLPYEDYYSVQRINVTANEFHPAEKDLSFITRLITKSARETDLILDPFMGSWTTARACKDMGRNFLGFELSEDYSRIGEKRLQQQNLF